MSAAADGTDTARRARRNIYQWAGLLIGGWPASGGGGGGARLLSLPPRLTARLEHELARGRGLVALLDFDGTLAPVVPDPAAAALAPMARSALAALAVNPRARLAVLSGRALADVRRGSRARTMAVGLGSAVAAHLPPPAARAAAAAAPLAAGAV
jgi:hypothetical protein